MNEDQLARFGKRTFFAGAVFALVWTTAAYLLDTPWWLNGLTAFAGSWLCYRLIERAAQHRHDPIECSCELTQDDAPPNL